MMEPPEPVRQWFMDAGWRPGRAVAVPPNVPRGHPAWDVLAAFGELVLLEREEAPDPDFPPSRLLAFQGFADPAVTDLWGRRLGSPLVGIADVDNAHGEMYLAADGRCFGASCVHPAFYFCGASLTEALERVLLHTHRARPMLPPGQESVTLYGERFTANSPELYRY